jgi:hypothetical protein
MVGASSARAPANARGSKLSGGTASPSAERPKLRGLKGWSGCARKSDGGAPIGRSTSISSSTATEGGREAFVRMSKPV